MAQRHEIEAWVNPSAWDDGAQAERVIDAIEASGSDSEAEWVRIAEGSQGAVLDAAARDYDRAGDAFEAAKGELQRAVRQASVDGLSEVEISRRAGVTRMTVRSWLGKAPK